VTLAGVFHEELERLPEVGDECDWNGFHFRIIDSRTRGHFRVLATKVPQEDENGEADES